ncbi:MAG: hypothetical protein AVDCRST_MAG93-51, partial [uncultured Chloroflexia bacterium]
TAWALELARIRGRFTVGRTHHWSVPGGASSALTCRRWSGTSTTDRCTSAGTGRRQSVLRQI